MLPVSSSSGSGYRPSGFGVEEATPPAFAFADINGMRPVAENTNISDQSTKVLVVGDAGAGKSSLVQLLSSSQALAKPWNSRTVGCSVELMLHEHRRRQYFIELWDVGGAKKYAKARTIFFNAPNGLILVHDLTNRKSFENLSGWIKQVIGADSFRWKGIGEASGSANSEDAFQQQHTFSSTILSHTSSFSSLPFSPFSSLTSDKPQTRAFSEHKLELELFRGSLPVLIIGTKADLWATSKFTALKPLSSSEIVEGHSLYVNTLDATTFLEGTKAHAQLHAFLDLVLAHDIGHQSHRSNSSSHVQIVVRDDPVKENTLHHRILSLI
ncbi:Rab-like protein 3 [Balamuthia mandrillaris]